LPTVRRDAGYQALRDRLTEPKTADVNAPHDPRLATHHPLRFSMLDAAKPALLAALHGELRRPVIILVSRLARARQLAGELATWADNSDAIHVFPELDALPYERLAPGVEHLYERLRAMLALCAGDRGWGLGDGTTLPTATPGSLTPNPQPPAPLVIVTARAAMDRLMDPEACRTSTWRIKVGDRIRSDQIIGEWVRVGYEPVAVVQSPGEFARRGGIIDIFPVGVAEDSSLQVGPVRIDLWGNDVESIRSFDPATQRSTEAHDEIWVGPAHEVLAQLPSGGDEVLAAIDTNQLVAHIRDEVEDELRRVREEQAFAYLEWYRGLLGTASILDYLPPTGLLILDEPGAVAATARELDRQAAELYFDLMARGEAPRNMPRPYWTWDELGDRGWGLGVRDAGRRRLDLVLDPDAAETSFRPAPTYNGRLPQLLDDIGSASRVPRAEPDHTEPGTPNAAPRTTFVIVSQQAARLEDLLAEGGGGDALTPDASGRSVRLSQREREPHPPSPRLPVSPSPHPPIVVHGALSEGWQNEAIGLTVLTDREIFGWAKIRRGLRRPGVSARERFLSDLEPGELVVHIDHGIGRYHGLVRIADRTTGLEREYLDIEYADNGRLRVPADYAARVNRYIGAGDAAPSLTKLGSGEWQRTKHRIRSAVQRIAKELVELYAHRELAETTPLGEDTQWQMELEASFPYVETPDQLQAVEEVKEDLERPRPMDRLLVGDVGYGKTEVALRAAFKAVSYGKQVGVLVPTTVLAQQHFSTFQERLAPFPVRVEVLSRFLTDRQAREVVEAVKDGRADIVIGTHRLLQKDVEFKDLGLVIIDEEQRFGVAHKERFKQFRTEVHVLTLSATPIPRTLHLSLVGVRDLSMIQTPPEERLAIRTYVREHDESLVREAILREIDRGGQVYYVSNRVYSIGAVAHRLSALVPEARIAIGHGQMSDDDLEETMLRFANGDADVLVCTTIIEAGLDLPNVNTIIVTNAHQFGLSQLYQLRGRVGRGGIRAYAYFLYPPDRQLTEVAERRLRAIFEATDLGAGYSIALKDLEIRGAGNLLGVEQHGHISAVGFDLYCRLLGEAVEQLKTLREQSLSDEGVGDRVLSGALLEVPAAAVNVPVAASLPDDYVADAAVRLSLYQRLSSVGSGPVLDDLMSEIEDRFGPLPDLAMNLFYLLSLRLAATEAGVEEIFVDDAELVVRFPRTRAVDATALGRAIGAQLRARANQVRMPLGRGAGWMQKLRELVDQLIPNS
jgi:transcription-repair coupling factor (superfamily II helicase)